MRFSKSSAAAIAASIPIVAAQTSTSCNPLTQTCPSDAGLTSSTYSADFTKGSSAAESFSLADGTTLNYGSGGAEFTITKAGQAPTISSDFYIFFGRVDVTMKASSGTGIISSIVLESDDLDEIDWEFFGTNTDQVETNFFGKGNTTTYNRATYNSVATPQSTYHTYTVDWNQDRLEFLIDGALIRTVPYDSPLALGGANYPQTPMRLKLGSWAAGGPGEPEGTVQWAGGNTDFSQSPFTMYIQSINIQNYNPGSSYVYGDHSGSWQSIKVENNGNSNSVSAGSATSSASGSASASSGSVATTAPTSMHTVVPITGAAGLAAPTTLTGSAYSTNTQSAAALNSAIANGTVSSAVPTITPSSSTVPSNSGASTAQIMAGSSLISLVIAAFLL